MLKHFRSASKRVRTIWWVLTIGTVVTFIGGFIVFGPNMGGEAAIDPSTPSVVAKVGGAEVSGAELNEATQRSLLAYQAQRGTAPEGRDAALMREQAWTTLITEKAIAAYAKRLGIETSDAEVVYVAKNSPPSDITLNPTFHTNGRFDMSKWQQALADPSINWSPLEERVRDLLPAQRLEERVVAGVKLSEPELKAAFASRSDSVRATVALFDLGPAPDSSRLDEASLKKYFDAHPSEFAGPEEAQLDVIRMPRTVGEDEERSVKLAMDGYVERVRSGGESFTAIVAAEGEGPYAANGGDLGQDIPLSSLPPDLSSMLATMPLGQITDPIRQGNTYVIFRLNERKEVAGQPSVRLSVLQKTIEPSAESAQKDAETMLEIRKDAGKEPLAAVAARHNLVAQSTGWFAQQMFVPAIMAVPQVQQWALTAKPGDVSRVYQLEGEWLLAQVTGRRAQGPRAFEDAREQVRAALQSDLQRQAPLEAARRMVAEVKAGKSFDEAARAAGGSVVATGWFTRLSPPPTLAALPQAIGLAFGLAPGQVGGPVSQTAGVAVVRTDEKKIGSQAQFEIMKGNLSQNILNERQGRYVRGWIEKLLVDAKLKDLRPAIEQNL
jgi:parvulin-like peptidyl-prolyl isomerase